jgi:hypothetical protein
MISTNCMIHNESLTTKKLFPELSEVLYTMIKAVNYIEIHRITGFLDFFPTSSILENTTFRKLNLFPSSGEGGGEDTYSVGPLRKS